MTVGSLFSGIGGFDLGLQQAGHETIWFCESSPFCQRVLRKHWPHVPIHPDVCELRSGDVARPDLLCGGFPCQDLSRAGNRWERLGLDGERSGLWREFHRLIRDLRPRFVLVENVPDILHRGIDRLLADMAEIGYDAEWESLSARAFGSLQRRERIFLLAYPAGERVAGILEGAIPRIPEFSWCEGIRSLEDLRKRSDLPPSLFRGGADGIPDWMDRLNALGNAVVPPIARWIGQRLKTLENDT